MNELNAKTNGKLQNVIDWFTKNRNTLFLAICFANHGFYTIVFHYLEVWQLSALNLVSCAFYFDFLFIRKDTSEKSIVYTYFEILLFSVLSEIALGPDYGFFLYIVGMSATVFYLVPSYGNWRFLFQLIGIITTVILEGVILSFDIRFPNIQEMMAPYRIPVFLFNTGITAVIVFGATFFYSQETEKVWESLRYSTNHDALTGLYNRRFLERYIEEIPYDKRTDYVVAMVDIDFFKKVNDTYGHEAGDKVLQTISSCLQETAGEKNLAVRWGGEEFILYFPDATQDIVYGKMEELRKEVEALVIPSSGRHIRITITSGIAAGLADSNYEKVILSADEKLYLGKQRGRNQVIV
ncbi:MAG: GGDEF domain-containing protein [Eubacterium sp.]|nr:GGDEF domain-containing protein [Eubacterium sp.]